MNRLSDIPGWAFDGTQLTRTFTWPSFQEAVAFVDRLAIEADAADHHPDIDIRYNAVNLSLSTHSAAAVTDKDFALAAAINRLAGV